MSQGRQTEGKTDLVLKIDRGSPKGTGPVSSRVPGVEGEGGGRGTRPKLRPVSW